MRLKQTRQQWEAFGRTDPLWAICTDESLKNNRWSVEDFFLSGETMIDEVMAHLGRAGVDLNSGRALDFGCGVGRLTQPLCMRFETCDGVDVAASMIELARSYNRYGERCRYHANAHDDLRLFGGGSFDFVLSLLVLQHMAPAYAKRYIAEFVRVLRGGGVAYFQVPDSPAAPRRPALPQGAHRAQLWAAFTSLELATGEARTVAVRVRNTGAHPWPAPDHARDVAGVARLGNHWLTARGQMVIRDDGRASMPQPVGPGDEIELELPICAPGAPGRYLLECDLVEEGVTWFALRGSPTLRVPVTVTGTAAPGGPQPRSPLRRRVFDRLRRAPSAPVMEMHCVPRDEVLSVVHGAGARVIDVADFVDAGEGFTSFRYVISR
jgi:SAM-dependent methyltransferase